MHAKIDDSPEGLALLLKGGHSSDHGAATPPAADGEDGELPPGMEDAAHDLMTSVKSGDHMGVAHALHNAHSIAAMHHAAKKE